MKINQMHVYSTLFSRLPNKIKLLILSLLTFVLVVSFQNCGKSFQSAMVEDFPSLVSEISGLSTLSTLQDKNVYIGDSTSFGALVHSSDEALLKYQWYLNGNSINGQNSEEIILTNIQTQDQGLYSVGVIVVESSNKEMINKMQLINVGNLVVVDPPPSAYAPVVISFNSDDQYVPVGSSFSLFVQHLEFPRGRVRWYKDGYLFSDDNKDVLVFHNVGLDLSGEYYAEIENSMGVEYTDEVYVEVYEGPPEFKKSIASNGMLSVYMGDTIRMSANVAGAGLDYKWYKDGVLVADQTTNSFEKANSTAADAGVYKLEVSNVYGKTIETVNLSVLELIKPVFNSDAIVNVPAVFAGDYLNINSQAAYGGSVLYRWYKDDVLIEGAIKSNFSKSNITINDAGVYKVEAYNTLGSTFKTIDIVIKPQEIPVFTSAKPNDVVIYAGDAISIYSKNATGGGVKYRWYKDEVLIYDSNISTSRFYKEKAQESDSGNYKVEAYNSAGSVFHVINVTVNSQIVPKFNTINLSGESVFIGERLSIYASDAFGGGVKYRWYKNNVIIDDAKNYYFSKYSVTATDAGVYKLEAYNDTGVASLILNVTVLNQTQPVFDEPALVDQAVFVGDNFTIRSGDVSGGGIRYRWYKDGVLLLGANDDRLYRYSATLKNAGTYKVEAYNSAGSAFQTININVANQTVPVFKSSAPANINTYVGDSFSIAMPIATGGGVKYRWYKDNVLIADAIYQTFSRSSVKTEQAGTYKIEAYNTAGSAFLSVDVAINAQTIPIFIGSLPVEKSIYIGETFHINSSGAKGGGVKYRWYKDDVLITEEMSYYLSSSLQENVETAIYKIEAYNSAGVASQSTRIIVKNHDQPYFTVNSMSASSTLYVGDNFSTYGLAAGGGIKYRWYKNDLLIAGATNYNFTISTLQKSDAGVYKLEAYNLTGSVSTSTALVVLDQATPVFNATLANEDVSVGERLSFSYYSGITGGEIKYRWYKNGILIPNETKNSYSKAVAELSDAGTYELEAYNTVGSAKLTAVATVKPQVMPSFTSAWPATPYSYYVNETIRLSSPTATGGALKYRWYFNDILVQNVTSRTFSKSNSVESDSGTYKVEAYNSIGSVIQSVSVIVNPLALPIFNQNLTNVVLNAGQILTLNTNKATGGEIQYRWYKDDVLIAGATNYYYQVLAANITAATAGVYKVEAYNSVGVTSSTCTVTLGY